MKKDTVIIVTGGNGYIGSTIVKKIKDAGAIPVVFDLHTTDGFEVNITNYDEVEKAVRSVVKKYGRIDGLVNCAGGSARREIRLFAEQKVDV